MFWHFHRGHGYSTAKNDSSSWGHSTLPSTHKCVYVCASLRNKWNKIDFEWVPPLANQKIRAKGKAENEKRQRPPIQRDCKQNLCQFKICLRRIAAQRTDWLTDWLAGRLLLVQRVNKFWFPHSPRWLFWCAIHSSHGSRSAPFYTWRKRFNANIYCNTFSIILHDYSHCCCSYSSMLDQSGSCSPPHSYSYHFVFVVLCHKRTQRTLSQQQFSVDAAAAAHSQQNDLLMILSFGRLLFRIITMIIKNICVLSMRVCDWVRAVSRNAFHSIFFLLCRHSIVSSFSFVFHADQFFRRLVRSFSTSRNVRAFFLSSSFPSVRCACDGGTMEGRTNALLFS